MLDMTEETLTRLWRLQTEMLLTEREFWYESADAVYEGLVRAEDVAEIFGCHVATARKRMNQAVDLKARKAILASWQRAEKS